MKYLFLVLFFITCLVSCDTNKKVIKGGTKQESIVVNTNTELALAGNVNFESNKDLNIKTAIIKNVMADKNGAYIGHKMDKLGLYFKENLDYSQLLRAGEGLILELDNSDTFYFDTGKTSLNNTSKKTLDVIINSLKNNPKLNLVIEVHTDNKGAETVNLEMTEKRGQSINSYFKEQGIGFERLNVIALGESYPLNASDSTDTLKENRRVAFGFYASEALKEEARIATESN